MNFTFIPTPPSTRAFFSSGSPSLLVRLAARQRYGDILRCTPWSARSLHRIPVAKRGVNALPKRVFIILALFPRSMSARLVQSATSANATLIFLGRDRDRTARAERWPQLTDWPPYPAFVFCAKFACCVFYSVRLPQFSSVSLFRAKVDIAIPTAVRPSQFFRWESRGGCIL